METLLQFIQKFKMHVEDWVNIFEDMEDAPFVCNRDDADGRKAKSKKQSKASITDWFRRCNKIYFSRVTGAMQTWFQFVLEEYRIAYLHKLAMARMKRSQTYTAHVALHPFQEKILDGLYFLARCGEVEDMAVCLKSHIGHFCEKMPQEKVQKRKSDEKRVEIQIPTIKKENDVDLSLSPIKEEKEEEPECVIIEDLSKSDEHSDTSADTPSDNSDTTTNLRLPIFDFL